MANLKVLKLNGVDYNIGFSSNDFTDDYKLKLDNVASDIATAKSEAIDAGKVTMTEAAGEGNVLKVYTFSQNGETIGTINTAKDLVVTSGEIVVVEDVKYLRLTIANQEAPVDIAVTDLVDVYTGSAYISIADNNEISVNFTALDTALLAETAKVGAAIKANSDATASLRTDLGTKEDEANVEGSAFARIANLKAIVSDLTGGSTESVEGQINAKIETLKGDSFTYADLSAMEAALAGEITRSTNADSAHDSAISAINTKLDGIEAGANKVTFEYESDSETLIITGGAVE